MTGLKFHLLARILGISVSCVGIASAETNVVIGYLQVEQPQPPTLSNLDPLPENNGLAGAWTGLDDNLTTGKFLGQTYSLVTATVAEGEDPILAAKSLIEDTALIIIDASASDLLAISDLPEAEETLLFNAAAQDVELRDSECRSNMVHTAASDAMLTDALAQVLVKKRWNDLVMISGVHPVDRHYANAVRRSLTKFGLSIQDEKEWVFDSDMRRNASQEVPLFTQDFGDYDAMILADEVHDFGRYVLYNTWQARPVVGSEGLTTAGWSPVIEQWGAAQLQSRFEEKNAREMTERDYAAWAAVRSIGEAVTRTNSTDVGAIRDYLLSDNFELAGFKGRPLTYRQWNGQLRQPIAIVHPRALVAQAPLEGFLHQVNELDTLGLDSPESTCEAFR